MRPISKSVRGERSFPPAPAFCALRAWIAASRLCATLLVRALWPPLQSARATRSASEEEQGLGAVHVERRGAAERGSDLQPLTAARNQRLTQLQMHGGPRWRSLPCGMQSLDRLLPSLLLEQVRNLRLVHLLHERLDLSPRGFTLRTLRVNASSAAQGFLRND